MTDTRKKLLLVDAYSLIYRSYYAFINNPRMSSKGLNTSVIFGFINGLYDAIKVNDPTHIAVLFDTSAHTFRHDLFPAYKANRQETPEDIRRSVPIIKDVLDALKITRVEKPGFEADDIAGSLSRLGDENGYQVVLFTTDKDYFQLVRENVTVYRPSKGSESDVYTVAKVCKTFEVNNTSQVIDILALWGDATDNVPGGKGIGEKTAKKLIAEYGSVENLLNSVDTIKGKLQETLRNEREQILLSKKLVTIDVNVPELPELSILEKREMDKDAVKKLFDELEFKTLLQRIGLGPSLTTKSLTAGQQLSLFDFPAPASKTIQEVVQEEDTKSHQVYDTIQTVTHTYHCVSTKEEREALINKLVQSAVVCFDTETTGLDVHSAEIVGLAIAIAPQEAYYIPMPLDYSDTKIILDEFSSFFTSTTILKVGQNLKFDIQMLQRYDIPVQEPLYDTMVAHYLLQPELRHNMDYLSESYLKYKPVSIEELIGKKGAQQLNMRDVPLDKIVEYACEDADVTLQLYHYFKDKVVADELDVLATKVEMPLVKVLAAMENEGIKLNTEPLKEFSIELQKESDQLEKEIIELSGGEPFNIASPKQLGDVLFDKLKIDPNAKRTKTQQYVTNEETLEKLADKHPIVSKILEYRGLKKLQSTYVDALPKLINPATGKIHSSFNQTITSTGRLSSVNPNLQNIPIRDEKGKELRKAFIPSQPDRFLLAADYSQIELRIMAHVSKDPSMIEAFQRGDDIHASTAAKIFGVPLEDVTKDMRRKAKTANFGIIYGISAFGLSQRLTIPRTEAKELIDGYFRSFPGVHDYMEACKEDARTKGYVETLMGRKRYLPDINSKNAIVRGFAERNAINAPIQGTAADIIKLAMVNMHRAMLEKKTRSSMILQVHDELLFDVVPEELDTLKILVKEVMESAYTLVVPLTVDVGVGKNWLEAH